MTRKKRSSPPEKLFVVFNYLFFALFTFICIYPFYYIIIYSVSDPGRAVSEGVFLWPAGFSLNAYLQVFRYNDISSAFIVSLSRTVLGTLLTIFACSFLAYLVSKKNMYFRKFVYRLLVATMYLNAGLIPWYLTMRAYGLRNNFLLYILPSAISAYFVILIKTYMENIPAELEESAMVEGAGYFTSYARIIFPVSMPIIAVIAVYASVAQWNAWTDNFFLVSDNKLQTLQIVLLNYLNEAEKMKRSTMELGSASVRAQMSPQTIRACITVIATVPILFAYPFLQRFFVKGIMVGAIKG